MKPLFFGFGAKRGEAEPEDLSCNLIVQLGVATEALNRTLYERPHWSDHQRHLAARQTHASSPVHAAACSLS